MKIWRVNDFGSTLIHPKLLFDSLTVRTVTVTAGVVMVLDVTAIGTLADRCTQNTGFTVQYGMRSFELLAGLQMMFRKIRIGVVPDLLDFRVIHDYHRSLKYQMGWSLYVCC